ncbi:MAG TPA: N-acetyl-gamma-glutamyl-phosphate reductase [Acidobacteriota bacterium]|nr:N-acetyl-gamma-glutamyl-phosphate reductase [Acidobacteriota bacterium]
MKVRVGVVGVTGYSGLELIKLLLRHPSAECAVVMASEDSAERPLSEIHPALRGLSELVCQPKDEARLVGAGVETAFLCTPNEVSYDLVPKLLAMGVRVIDLSGSFRLKDETRYPTWYGFTHSRPDLVKIAVYGLPEWNAKTICGAKLVANPGCYPTSVLLPLLPLVRAGMLSPGSEIVCDSKSGVTGAGRSARLEMLFGEVSGNFRPYSPIRHRHLPEMCQELGWDIDHFTFVPHLLPTNRGILSTIYLELQRPVAAAELDEVYEKCYETCSFVRILGNSRLPELRAVNFTNFCDIGWRLTSSGRRAVIFSAIDNLVKGAAGQAIQNFNLVHGLEECTGLSEGRVLATHG